MRSVRNISQVTRALEAAFLQEEGSLRSGDLRFATDLFIRPGFEFRVVDALLTNFHLPRSTLLMLVSAFAGRERILAAYAEAVRARYRFFSFGGYGSDSDDRTELTRRALERASLVYGVAIEPAQSVAIGDTPLDVTAAHKAGIECVGVASGHFSVEQLRQAGADYAIGSLEDDLPV